MSEQFLTYVLDTMYQKHTSKKESAASPVVGVMLMLVVTIIVAAVIATFAGGLTAGKQVAPVIALDVKMVNGGNFYDSYFEADVLSVSEPIPTSDLKITTSWLKNTGDKANSTWVSTSTGELPVNWTVPLNGGNKAVIPAAPWGYGANVNANSGVPSNSEQGFGNYTLIGGTVLYVYPAGQTGGFVTPGAVNPTTGGYKNFEYTGTPDDQIDGMQSLFGDGWETLKAGSKVNVKIVHVPSSTTIFEKEITVS